MQVQPNLPDSALNLPTLNVVQSFPALPRLEIQRIPVDHQKAQCFRDCVNYLVAEATSLRSKGRYFDALKHIDVALTLEALLHSGHGDV